MKLKKKIIFLIPAKNEEKNIKNVLVKFRKYGKVIVVNDHSTDNTFNIAKQFAHKILNLKYKSGYDATLKFGLKHIINNISGNYVITVDADGEHSHIFIAKLINKMKNKYLVIGNRSKYNRWSEYFCGFLSYFFFSIKDPLSGMKCYNLDYLKKNKKRVLEKLNPKIDQCGMFFFKIYNLKEVTNVNIKTNNSNKPSSVGSGLLINLKIIKFFFNAIF
jgi:glycosyltransferase involved in cell wall biosynthesis